MNKAEEAKEISVVYKLLSKAFIREIDVEFLRHLRTKELCDSLKALDIDFGDQFLSQDEGRLLEDLAVEYARLFIVPGSGLSLYESVYAEERYCGEPAQQVEEFYQKCGMGIVDETLMPDHISLELELMSYLKQKEAELLQNGNQDATKWLELQKEFMSTHLSKWIPQFFAHVEEAAEHLFYKEMAKLGRQFIAVEGDLKQAED